MQRCVTPYESYMRVSQSMEKIDCKYFDCWNFCARQIMNMSVVKVANQESSSLDFIQTCMFFIL